MESCIEISPVLVRTIVINDVLGQEVFVLGLARLAVQIRIAPS